MLGVVQPFIAPVAHYPHGGMPAVPARGVASYLNRLKVQHEKVLSRALKKAKKEKPDLRISRKLLEGRPSNRIIETAKEGSFDMIVMGSRGLGGIKQFFLGSVSDRVADEAPCPVLIVK